MEARIPLQRGDRIGPLSASLRERQEVTKTISPLSPNTEWAWASPTLAIKFENLKHRPAHSCRPNCAVILATDGTPYIECMMAITPGAEITCDWTIAGLYPGAHPQHRCTNSKACTGTTGSRPPHVWTRAKLKVKYASTSTYTQTRRAPVHPRPLTLTSRLKHGHHGTMDPKTIPADFSRTVDRMCELTYDTMQRLDTPSPDTSASTAYLCDNIVAAWLEIWARQSGCGYDTTLPSEGNDTWIAHPSLYYQIHESNGYDVWHTRKTLRHIPLTQTDSNGSLIIKRVLIPICKRESKHWILLRMDLIAKQITIFDWIRNPLFDPDTVAAECGRWWDDISRIHNGLSWDAQGWPVTITRPYMQENPYDCGLLLLAHTCKLTSTNASKEPACPAPPPKSSTALRRMITSDLMAGQLVHALLGALSPTRKHSRNRPTSSPSTQTDHTRPNTRKQLCPKHHQQPTKLHSAILRALTGPYARTTPSCASHQTTLPPPPAPKGKHTVKTTKPPPNTPDPPAKSKSTSKQNNSISPTNTPDPPTRPSTSNIQAKHTTKQAPQHTRQAPTKATDFPTSNIKIATLNLGTGGLRKALTSLRAWALADNIGVLHLQEAYNMDAKKGKRRPTGLWTDLTKHLPEYTLYHGHSPHRHKIVVTLVRKTLQQWTTVMPLSPSPHPDGHPLQGRLITIRIHPPHAEATIFANVWMPDSSHTHTAREQSYTALQKEITQWQTHHKNIILAGDFNAALHSTTNLQYRNPLATRGSHLAKGDALLQNLIAQHNLTTDTIQEPTWSGTSEAKLDYILFTRSVTWSTPPQIDQAHDIRSDHEAITATLDSPHGHLPPERHRQHTPKINNSTMPDLAHVYSAEVQTNIDNTPGCSLQQARQIMWEAAKNIFGTQTAPTHKPRHRDAEMKAHNKTIRALTQLRKLATQPGRYDTTHSATKWLELLALTPPREGMLPIPHALPTPSPQTTEIMRLHIAAARRHRDQDIRERDHEEMQQNCERARRRVDHAKRGIQQAMGKQTAFSEITKLQTTHPTTIHIATPPDCKANIIQTIHHIDAKATSATAGHITTFTTSKLDAMTDILEAAHTHQWTITAIPHTTTTVTAAPDLLASLEHKLGDDGRAREWTCPHCKTHSHLTTIGSTSTGTRQPRTICRQCCQLVQPELDDTTYHHKPWGPTDDIFTNHRMVPEDTPLRLRQVVTMADLRTTIRKLKLGRAPGEDAMQAELYKHAPDAALQPLLRQINQCIMQSADLPEEWKGGMVKLLMKKEPTDLLKNWRPICMANTEYKIYSRIITVRLQRIAERHGILEETQEGFRPEHSTRRQVERLLHILHRAKDKNSQVYLTFIDFSNAFNSIDLTPSFEILEKYGIPDVHLIRKMYEGASFKAEVQGQHTGPISLTRGTKQGDPLSPTLFNLVINILLRMMATSGHALHITNDEAYSCGGFADDIALIQDSARSTNAMLNGPIALFCKWTSMEINTQKSIVSAIDYATNKNLPTDMIHYNGHKLESSPKDTANKYLGIHIALSLDWATEKKYIITKTKQAARHLKRTCLRRDQIDMLLRTCIEPLFRYSAPLVPWTPKELHTIDRIWAQVKKASLQLTPSTDTSIIMLHQNQGGLGMHTAATHCAKELRTHILQCRARPRDELSTLISTRIYDLLSRANAIDMEQVATNLSTHNSWHLYTSSPIFRLQHILTNANPNWSIYLNEVPLQRPPDELAQAIRAMQHTAKRNSHLFPMGTQQQPGEWNHAEALIYALHTQNMYTVRDVTKADNLTLYNLSDLPTSAQKHLTTKTYSQLQARLYQTSTMRAARTKHTIRKHLTQNITHQHPALPQKRKPDTHETYQLHESAWADAADFQSTPDTHPHIGTYTMKQFQGKWFAGIVVAAAPPHETDPAWGFRIVYSDGDTEDATHEQILTGQTQALDFDENKGHRTSTPMPEQIQEAEWYSHQWRTGHQTHIDKAADIIQTRFGISTYIATHKWTQKPWHQVVHHIDMTTARSGYIYATLAHVNPQTGTITHGTKRRRITAEDYLGQHTPIATTHQTIPPAELARLHGWGEHEDTTMQDRDNTDTNRHTRLKDTMLGHISHAPISFAQNAGTLPAWQPPIPYTTDPLTGQGRSYQFEIDWNTQTPRITTSPDKNHIAITRNGTTTLYSKQPEGLPIPINPLFPAASRKTRLRTGWINLGSLDARSAHTLAARNNTTLGNSLTDIADRIQGKQDTEPHWLLTHMIQSAQRAKTIIGIHPANPDPSYEFCISTPTHTHTQAIDTTALTDGPAVIWLTATSTITKQDIKDIIHKATHTIILIHGTQTPTLKTWIDSISQPAAHIARGTPVIQHAKSSTHGALTPVQTKTQISIRYTGTLDTLTLQRNLATTFWDQPYTRIPALTGPWWDMYHSHDQAAHLTHAPGVVVATDGSSRTVITEDGKVHLAGGGTTYRPQDNIPDDSQRIDCDLSSLIPEMHAVRMAAEKAPIDQKLTIATDSATVIWIASALNQHLFWRNFKKHPQLKGIKQMTDALDRRTARTAFVKVASHKGCYMNERADDLAGQAASLKREIEHEYHTRYAEDLEIHTGERMPTDLRKLILTQLPQATANHTRITFLQHKPTQTLLRLQAPNSGRNFLGAALQRMDRRATRRAIQILTKTFPSQTRLVTWGLEQNATCPYCGLSPETTEHFSQFCPQFADARTAAHDSTWGAIWTSITANLDKGWDSIHDTQIKNTAFTHDAEWANAKPDGMLHNETTGDIIILEFKRSTGYTGADTDSHWTTKKASYEPLAAHLTARNTDIYNNGAKVCALVCTFSGAINDTQWTATLSELPLHPDKTTAPEKIKLAAVQGALEAFSTMADIREIARRARTTSDTL